MNRKKLTRQVTKTTIKVSKMEMVEGSVKSINLPDEVMIGNISVEQAQRHMDKMYHPERVTVLQVQPETKTYEMLVEEFIKVAQVKEEK